MPYPEKQPEALFRADRFEPYIEPSSPTMTQAAAPIPGGVEFADYAKSVMAGGASLVQATGWLAGVLGADDLGETIETLGNDAVDFWNDSLSDPAKAEISKQIIRKNDQGEYEWGDPSFSTVGLMGAQSLLGTAAGMGVGAGLTKVLQVFANPFGRKVLEVAAKAQARHPGMVAGLGLTKEVGQAAKKLKLVDMVLGAGGFGVGEGAIGGISAGASVDDSVYAQVMSQPQEKMMENARYRAVYESTDDSISELERHQYAADTLAKEAGTAAGWQTGLTTALLGAPMGAYFGRILGGARLSSTLPRAVATGAAGEAAQEFAQSGVEQILSNVARQPFEPELDTYEGALNAAVGGALAGGLLGGAIGPASIKGSRLEIKQDKQDKEAERNLIGGVINAQAQKAATAGVEKEALDNIIADWKSGDLSTEHAQENIEALVEAKAAGVDAQAKRPPPPGSGGGAAEVGKAPGSTQDEAGKPSEPTQAERETQAEVAATEQPIQPVGGPAELEQVNLAETEVDAARFQFKAQTDAQGVSSRLKGLNRYDRTKAGVAIVYEEKDGTRYAVDGHQRRGLAVRAIEAGQDPSEVLTPAYVFREADGVTAEEVTLIAATKNIAEGSGSPVDAAKVMRQLGAEGEREMNLPPNSQLVQQARGLSKLDDDAFAKIVNEVIDPKHASIVGELIHDGKLQNAAIEVLRQTEPANAAQARAIVEQVRTAGVETTETEDLFGAASITESLYLERAKVLDAAQKLARRDKATFKTLTNRESSITGTGKNQLDRAANEAKISDADRVLTALATVANTKGPISDALTEAARQVKAGKQPGSVAQGFLKAALGSVETGNQGRRQPGKPESADAQGQQKTVAEALVAEPDEKQEEVFSRGIDRGLSANTMMFLEREVLNPVQRGEVKQADNPGIFLLADAVNTKDQHITLPNNAPALLAVSKALDDVIFNMQSFLSAQGPVLFHRDIAQMHSSIKAMQGLSREAIAAARAAVQPAGDQVDMFGAPQADFSEHKQPESYVETQGQLFSRSGQPLSEITLTREFEVEETGETVEVEQNAEVLLRQLSKRIDVVRQLRGCIGG